MLLITTLCHRVITLSSKDQSDRSVPLLLSSGPSHHVFNVRLLSVTFSSPTQSCDAPQSAWRDIGIESGLALIPLLTRLLLSLKGQSDRMCSATAYSPEPSHHFFDMGLSYVTLRVRVCSRLIKYRS